MALVNNLKELQKLLDKLNLRVESVDQLRELLLTVQQANSQDPSVRQEWAAWQERQQAASERAREQRHTERLRALEQGITLPDPETVKAQLPALRTAARAACWLGTLVTLGALGAGVGATTLLRDTEERFLVPVLAIVWGVCGLVALVTALVSLGVMRRVRTAGVSSAKPKPPQKTFVDAASEIETDNKELAGTVA